MCWSETQNLACTIDFNENKGNLLQCMSSFPITDFYFFSNLEFNLHYTGVTVNLLRRLQ